MTSLEDESNEFRGIYILGEDLNKLHLLLSSYPPGLIHDCFYQVFGSATSNNKRTNRLVKRVSIFINFSIKFLMQLLSCLFVLTLVYLFVITHNGFQKFVLRKAQNNIYPIMRSLRLWTLPLLQRYSNLSDWYEEECLVRNPLYYDVPIDCWPCEDIRTLVDLTSLANYSFAYVYNEQPFIVKDSLEHSVSFEDLQALYLKHRAALDHGTAKFICSENRISSPRELFEKKISVNTDLVHIMWKINRVAAAHVLRRVFPRPYFIPNSSEVTLERFIYLSGVNAPQFYLPPTDFANVWVAQGQGYRLLVLDPSRSCMLNCTSVSVLLRPLDVLYYNWQFWRPRSLPTRFSEEISVTYIGSFY